MKRIEKINELMKNIHVLHQQCEREKGDFYAILEEFDDETSDFSLILKEIQKILISDERIALEYFKQCSPFDFYIIISQHTVVFRSDTYRALVDIWQEKATKQEKAIYNDVIEYLVHDENFVKDNSEAD